MRRTAVGISLAVLSCVLAAPASATPPTRAHFEFTGISFPVDLCPFGVTDNLLIAVLDETTHYDSAGRVTRVQDQFHIQDSFSANGHTLNGEPYFANATTYFDTSGNVINTVAQGVLTRVPLPAGGQFIGAGRVDPFNGVAFAPTYGAFQNVDAFCAALAP